MMLPPVTELVQIADVDAAASFIDQVGIDSVRVFSGFADDCVVLRRSHLICAGENHHRIAPGFEEADRFKLSYGGDFLGELPIVVYLSFCGRSVSDRFWRPVVVKYQS